MAKRRHKILDKGRPEAIASKINQALNIAMRETEKTQEQIAKEIGVNKNTLTNWRKKRSVPSDYDFESFLNFLGKLDPPITEEFFNGAFNDDPYSEDPDYVAAMENKLKQYANDIGLDLNFLRFVVSIMKDAAVDEEFYYYQWGPIRTKDNKVPSDPEKLDAHERLMPVPSNVAESAGDFRVGNRILSQIDLNVIKDIQDHVLEDVGLMFLKRRLDMSRELRVANEFRKEKYLKAKERSGGAELSDKDIVLTVGELSTIDKYYRINFQNVPADTLITDIPFYTKRENGGDAEQ